MRQPREQAERLTDREAAGLYRLEQAEALLRDAGYWVAPNSTVSKIEAIPVDVPACVRARPSTIRRRSRHVISNP